MRLLLILVGMLLVGCVHIDERARHSDGAESEELFLCGRYYLDNGIRVYFVDEGSSPYESESVLLIYDDQLTKEILKVKQGGVVRFVVRSVDPCKDSADTDRLACFQKDANGGSAYRFVRKMQPYEFCGPVSIFKNETVLAR